MKTLSLLLFVLCFGSSYGNKSEQTDTIVQLSQLEMLRIAAERAARSAWAGIFAEEFKLAHRAFWINSDIQTVSVKPKNCFIEDARRADSLFWANPENVEHIRQIYEDADKVREIHKDFFETMKEYWKEIEILKIKLWKHNQKICLKTLQKSKRVQKKK